jgi:hypothetical protein
MSATEAQGSSTAEPPAPPEANPKTFAEKQRERLQRLRNLHTLRNEARSHNHQEVIAEDARNKLPANWEARKKRAEWILNDQKAREEAAQSGEDYDRKKASGDIGGRRREDRAQKEAEKPRPGLLRFRGCYLSTVQQVGPEHGPQRHGEIRGGQAEVRGGVLRRAPRHHPRAARR